MSVEYKTPHESQTSTEVDEEEGEEEEIFSSHRTAPKQFKQNYYYQIYCFKAINTHWETTQTEKGTFHT